MSVSPFKGAIGLAIAFSGVSNLLMLVPTLYMLQVYDRVLVSGSLGTLAAVSIMAAYLFAMMALAEWARSRVLARLGQAIETSLAPRVFRASFEAQLRATSGLIQRGLSDLAELRQFVSSGGATAMLDLPWSPLYLGVLFLLHPWLGLSALLFALVQLAIALITHRNILQPSAAASLAQARETHSLTGYLQSAESVHAMGMTGALTRKVMRFHAQFTEAHGHALSLTHRQAAVSRFMRYLQQSLILAVGAVLVIRSEISAASMIAANILMNRALSPIDTVVATWRNLISARQAKARLKDFLLRHETSESMSAIQPETNASGSVLNVRNLVARAPGRDTPILQGLSLEASAGSITLVVGPSGSGKSTLMRALTGSWPDLQGEVMIVGQSVQSCSDDQRAASIGFVPQDIELFNGSIAENISRFEGHRSGAVSDPAIAQTISARVIEAARAAGLHESILRLPAGYDTAVSGSGGVLSGGQRQRIALARALYGQPRLLVLDEPNANLDDAGESALAQALRQRRAEGACIVVVSHAPTLAALADRVLVMSEGRISTEQIAPSKRSAQSPPILRPSMPQP